DLNRAHPSAQAIHAGAHVRQNVVEGAGVHGSEASSLSCTVTDVVVLTEQPAELHDAEDEKEEERQDEGELDQGRALLSATRPHRHGQWILRNFLIDLHPSLP